MKNSNDNTGNRTRDLPTAPPRAPVTDITYIIYTCMYIRGAVLLFRFVKEQCRTYLTTFQTHLPGTIQQNLSLQATNVHVFQKSPAFRQPKLGVNSGFRREDDENGALLGCYAASSCNLLPTFRDNQLVFKAEDSFLDS
jgi:hypothetical protein